MCLKKNKNKTQLYFNLKFPNSSTLTFHTEGRSVGSEPLRDTWTETDRSHFQAERREAERRVGKQRPAQPRCTLGKLVSSPSLWS